jgi:hypothetical protein
MPERLNQVTDDFLWDLNPNESADNAKIIRILLKVQIASYFKSTSDQHFVESNDFWCFLWFIFDVSFLLLINIPFAFVLDIKGRQVVWHFCILVHVDV